MVNGELIRSQADGRASTLRCGRTGCAAVQQVLRGRMSQRGKPSLFELAAETIEGLEIGQLVTG